VIRNRGESGLPTSKKARNARKIPIPSAKVGNRRSETRSSSGNKSFQEKLKLVDWTDLELFLDVVEAGSLRAGASKTGRAVGTIRRRLQRIEDKLSEVIAQRGPSGLRLTRVGEKLLLTAREMRLTRQSAEAVRPSAGERERIRMAVTEGLGTYWLMPRLVEFQRANPGLDVDLHCDMSRSDVAGGECDLAVQLEPPAEGTAIVRHIGCLHLMPFAAESYLKVAGTPTSVDEWPNHKLVWQEADQVASYLLPFILGRSEVPGLISIRTNSSSAHFRAIATGGGIGILPTYARAISRRVRPLDLDVRLRREIFCVANPAKASSSGVQSVITWLTSCFAGDIYPWFRDEFVHPRDFEQAISSRHVIGLFEGFIDNIAADEPD